ncbi:MAG: hypothetical protein RR350_07645 [Oscillibacter sp.]
MNVCNNTLNLAAVPREIRDDFARPLALAVDAYFKRPGVEEDFQRWLIDYRKRKADQKPTEQA